MDKLGLVSHDEANDNRQFDLSTVPSIETSPEYTVCSYIPWEMDTADLLSLLTRQDPSLP